MLSLYEPNQCNSHFTTSREVRHRTRFKHISTIISNRHPEKQLGLTTIAFENVVVGYYGMQICLDGLRKRYRKVDLSARL